MKRLGLLIVLIFILLSGWIFGKITYKFSLHSYLVTSSFWRLGSRYSYTISTCDGKSIKLRGRTQEEEDKLFFDEIILPKDVSDTIYLSMDELVVENNGFVVEKFVAPHLERDARNSRILKINYGTHYEKIFYIERITRDNADYFVYDQVKDKYVRFTVGGGGKFSCMVKSWYEISSCSPGKRNSKSLGNYSYTDESGKDNKDSKL